MVNKNGILKTSAPTALPATVWAACAFRSDSSGAIGIGSVDFYTGSGRTAMEQKIVTPRKWR